MVRGIILSFAGGGFPVSMPNISYECVSVMIPCSDFDFIVTFNYGNSFQYRTKQWKICILSDKLYSFGRTTISWFLYTKVSYYTRSLVVRSLGYRTETHTTSSVSNITYFLRKISFILFLNLLNRKLLHKLFREKKKLFLGGALPIFVSTCRYFRIFWIGSRKQSRCPFPG